MDYSNAIRQTKEALENCVKTIASTEAASKADGVDRSGSVASISRDKMIYEARLKDIEAKQAAEAAKATPSEEPAPKKLPK
jgi:hypothetical protein